MWHSQFPGQEFDFHPQANIRAKSVTTELLPVHIYFIKATSSQGLQRSQNVLVLGQSIPVKWCSPWPFAMTDDLLANDLYSHLPLSLPTVQKALRPCPLLFWNNYSTVSNILATFMVICCQIASARLFLSNCCSHVVTCCMSRRHWSLMRK